jgi:hypothetical protein
MILWSVSSIGKRVFLLSVLALSVWLLIDTPANGQAATAPATSTAPTKATIQAAQKRLLALGYQCGATDGILGSKAIAALKKFQADHALPVTGQLNRKTLDALNASPTEIAIKSKTNGPDASSATITVSGRIFEDSQGDEIAFAKNGRAVEANGNRGMAYAGQAIYFGEDGNTPRTECSYNQDGINITLTCEPDTKAVFKINKDGSLSGPPEGMWGQSAFAHLVLMKQRD